MTPAEEDGVRVLREAYERWEKMPPVALTIGRVEAYQLILACQTMMTHPVLPQHVGTMLESIGRQLMEAVCDNPEIYALSSTGWNRAFDIDPENI